MLQPKLFIIAIIVGSYLTFIILMVEILPTMVPAQDTILNGSLQYTPATLGMMLSALTLASRGIPVWRYCLTAALIYCVSLVFRNIDMIICSQTQFGSHFFRHLLNAVVLALLMNAVIGQQRVYSYSQ